MTFLIVDDSREKIHFLQHLIKRSGWAGEVLIAVTTEAAMELINQHTIDAAFIDYYVPSACGPVVIRHLKKVHPNAHIALVSSADNEENSAEARAAGAEFVICTSWQSDVVEGEILDLLKIWKIEK